MKRSSTRRFVITKKAPTRAAVAAFNQVKALVGAFSVITNLRMELFEALVESTSCHHHVVCHLVDLVVVLLVEADAPRLLAVKVSAHAAPPLRALQPVLACGTVQYSTVKAQNNTVQYLEQYGASFIFAKFVGSFKDK